MNILEIIGVITFSAAGTYQAIIKKMDLFGVYILAITTAAGGGIIRDVVMDRGIPLFFTSNTMILTAIASATVILLLRNKFTFNKTIVMLDALGLGAFAVDAGIKAIESNYSFSSFVFVAIMTGVGGGILRDLLSGDTPAVFHRDVYAVAALTGVVFLWFAYPILGIQLSGYLSVAIVFAVRTLCFLYKINLPVIKINSIGEKNESTDTQ